MNPEISKYNNSQSTENQLICNVLAKEIDLAVHSCKDLPTEFPEGPPLGRSVSRA